MIHRIPVHPTAHPRASVIEGEHAGKQCELLAVCYDDQNRSNYYDVRLDGGGEARIQLHHLQAHGHQRQEGYRETAA